MRTASEINLERPGAQRIEGSARDSSPRRGAHSLTRLDLRWEVAEESLNGLRRTSATEADVECPGSARHTTPGQMAKLFLDPVPTIHCFHSHCSGIVSAANEELRAECRRREKAAGFKLEWTREERRAWTERKRGEHEAKRKSEVLAKAAKQHRDEIIQIYRRPLSAWIIESPHDAPRQRRTRHLGAWMAALPPDWRIWIGHSSRDTGHKWNTWNFATVEEWLRRHETRTGFGTAWQQVCPAIFHSLAKLRDRRKCAVIERRLFTVEFDEIDLDPAVNKECGMAVVDWLRRKCGLRLFSACDSGNKSVHALFAWPEGGPKEWNRLTTILQGMGADHKVWGLASTTRLPGGMRFDEADEDDPPYAWQRLYYLDPSALVGAEGSSTKTHPDHKTELSKLSHSDEESDDGVND